MIPLAAYARVAFVVLLVVPWLVWFVLRERFHRVTPYDDTDLPSPYTDRYSVIQYEGMDRENERVVATGLPLDTASELSRTTPGSTAVMERED